MRPRRPPTWSPVVERRPDQAHRVRDSTEIMPIPAITTQPTATGAHPVRPAEPAPQRAEADGSPAPGRRPPTVLVIACGALARELGRAVELNGLANVTVDYLPGRLHNRPERIPEAIESRLAQRRHAYDRVLLGYGDCGTGGRLDELCRRLDLERLPGDHCYEFYAGSAGFAALHDAEPGSFYLTDYLARHFDAIVMASLGLDQHPELLELYFGNYRRLVHLAQTEDAVVEAKARRAADILGLEFHSVSTGIGRLETGVVSVALGAARSGS